MAKSDWEARSVDVILSLDCIISDFILFSEMFDATDADDVNIVLQIIYYYNTTRKNS